MWVLEICFTCPSTTDNTKLFTHYCTWSRSGNSGVLLSWPVCDTVSGDSHRLFLTLKLQDDHFSHMQCDICSFRDTLSAAWPCLLLQAISESWQRWVCVCLGSGSRFSLSPAIAKLLCNRTPPPSETSAAILPPLLTPVAGSVCMCHTAPRSVHSGTADIRGHGSLSSAGGFGSRAGDSAPKNSAHKGRGAYRIRQQERQNPRIYLVWNESTRLTWSLWDVDDVVQKVVEE